MSAYFVLYLSAIADLSASSGMYLKCVAYAVALFITKCSHAGLRPHLPAKHHSETSLKNNENKSGFVKLKTQDRVPGQE